MKAHASLFALALVFLALHLPYLPSSLEDLDSINFALGVHRFDVVHHRPHPPGYPVFVVAAKISRLLIGTDARALAAVSVVAGTIGVFAIGGLYRRLSPEHPGQWSAVAAALATTSPLYWFTAARPISDMMGLAAAVAVQAMTLAAETERAIVVASFCGGVTVGIRSQVFWLTVPLLVWVLVRRQTPSGRGVLATGPVRNLTPYKCAAAFTAGVVAWLAPLVIATGGPASYWRALSDQGAEDLSGIRMLWTTPTARELVDAGYYAFVAPWGTWPTAILIVAFALIGGAILVRHDRRALMLVALAFGPYLIFDVMFQETFTSRYALPIVIPIAWLAMNGLSVLPHPAAVVAAAGLLMFHAHVGGRSIAAYARHHAPAFALLDDMRRDADAEPGSPKPILAPDRRQSFDLRRPLVWLGEAAPSFDRQLAAPPQHEWLEAVSYWNSGGRAPVWFVVDPRRAAMAMIQHSDPVAYRWSLPYPVLASGTRPGDIDWYRIDRPEWYLGQGWSLTPEAAGIAAADHRGLEYGPIEGWIRSAALRSGGLLFGGRNLEATERPQVMLALERGWSTTVQVKPGAFLELVRLPPMDSESLVPEYLKVTVTASPPARVAIEQFDASSSRGVVGFGDGWYEPEFDPATGRRWRWLSGRGELRYVTGESGSSLHLEGESPRTYYPRASRVVVRAGDVVLRDAMVSDDFSMEVPVPRAVDPSMLVVETDQTHVPAATSWRGSRDRRRLGLRIFRCELRPRVTPSVAPASAPGTAANSPRGR
ncbi:MAG TPA: hypothetical protein VGY48_34080 [Vicinamibacterales bacterium]|nr:hypothetical protein [Vicinamibacterales bacterium]